MCMNVYPCIYGPNVRYHILDFGPISTIKLRGAFGQVSAGSQLCLLN